MRTHIKHCTIFAIIAAIAAPAPASALTMEYVSYGGFDTLVTGFQRLALIFSDDNYMGLFASFAILGILFGGLAMYVRGIMGQQVSFLGWTIPILVGVALFQGLILPKGDIVVYDSSSNEFQTIGDVPDAIVAIAGITNLVERGIVDSLDTASAYPYAEEGGGVTFDLMLRATSEDIGIDDTLLTKTIITYVKQCSPVALASPATGISDQTIKIGTNDLKEQLAGMALVSTYTTVYNNANKWGFSSSCKDAWDLNIDPFLTDATFESAEKALCAKIGKNPNSADQMTSCRALMQSAMEKFGIARDTYTSPHFVRNIFLAQAIDAAMQDQNPDLGQRAIANRNLMTQGIGISNAANEWLPQVRAIMTVVALGMVPVLALFLVTPMMGKVIVFTLGLFGWLMLWGIMDAAMHEMAMDGAIAFFERATSEGFGLVSIWTTPEDSAKALALFGKAKTYAIMMASVIAMALFKFGGYAFSQMAEGWANHIERAGSDAAMANNTPEGRARQMAANEDAIAKHALRSQFDVMDVAGHQFRQAFEGVGATQAMGSLAQQSGMSRMQLYQSRALEEGAQAVGHAEAISKMTELRGGDPMNPTDRAETTRLAELTRTASYYGDQDGARSAAIALGGGNEFLGYARAGYIPAMQRMGSNATTGEIIEEMRKDILATTGKNALDSELYQAVGEYQAADLWSNIKATGGNSQDFVNLVSMTKDMDLNEKREFFDILQSQGSDPKNAGFVAGWLKAGKTIGEWGAIKAMPFKDVAAGYKIAALSQGKRGSAFEEAAAYNGLKTEDLVGKVESMGAERSFARVEQLSYLMHQTGLGFHEAILAQEGGGQSITLSGRALDSFLDNAAKSGVLTQQQQQFLETHRGTEGGVKIGYSVDLNDPNGQIVHLSMSSGSDVLVSHSGRADTSTSASAGDTKDANTIQLIYNGEYENKKVAENIKLGLAKTLAADWEGAIGKPHQFDAQESRNYFDNVNEIFRQHGALEASSQDAQRYDTGTSGGLTFNSERAIWGRALSLATGVVIIGNAEGGVNGSTSDQETTSHNLGTMYMQAGIAIAVQQANELLANRGLSVDSADPANSAAASEERARIVAERMENLVTSLTSYLDQRGNDAFNDSDAYDDIFKKWSENGGSPVYAKY